MQQCARAPQSARPRAPAGAGTTDRGGAAPVGRHPPLADAPPDTPATHRRKRHRDAPRPHCSGGQPAHRRLPRPLPQSTHRPPGASGDRSNWREVSGYRTNKHSKHNLTYTITAPKPFSTVPSRLPFPPTHPFFFALDVVSTPSRHWAIPRHPRHSFLSTPPPGFITMRRAAHAKQAPPRSPPRPHRRCATRRPPRRAAGWRG